MEPIKHAGQFSENALMKNEQQYKLAKSIQEALIKAVKEGRIDITLTRRFVGMFDYFKKLTEEL